MFMQLQRSHVFTALPGCGLFKTEIRWKNGIKNMQDMYIHEVDFLIVNFPLQENDEIFIIELYNTLKLAVNLMTKNHQL